MAGVVKLQLINKSNDGFIRAIVVCQKNLAPNFGEIVVAWKVIEYLGNGDRHPFDYTLDLKLDAGDSFGNNTPQIPAIPGKIFQMVSSGSGDFVQPVDGNPGEPDGIEVRNDLAKGAIRANIYRSDALVATAPNVVPGQKAAFRLGTTIFVGVIPEAEAGTILTPEVVSSLNTELSLLGIRSAEIVLAGGGLGASAMPYSFSLENVVFE